MKHSVSGIEEFFKRYLVFSRKILKKREEKKKKISKVISFPVHSACDISAVTELNPADSAVTNVAYVLLFA